ncbi:MAG: glycoside hydrolase family 35 protein [Bacteroidota bacterium]
MRHQRIAPALFLITLLSALPVSPPSAHAGSFAVEKGQFFLNGKPFRIISGEIHYPRIPREYWRDRMIKAKAMGLNTICTYIFWNAHEPRPGTFDFSGDLDVATFIKTAQEVGLWVMIRPGPYVCTEWDFGGLPAWLLRDPEARIRCNEHEFMEASRRYLIRLGREIAGLQITRGGPIILAQLENEYGSYGNDKVYLAELGQLFREAGFTIPLYTSDGSGLSQLEAGALPSALPVVNFGGGAQRHFENLASFRSGIPAMCGEFWCGWFTHWGDQSFGGADIEKQRADIEWMLNTGKSFNFYMFHGGTNFGFWAGANFGDRYEPDITSYDYDAPLDEAGRPTAKYFNLREVISRSSGTPPPAVPGSAQTIEIPAFLPDAQADLFAHLAGPVGSVQPRSMESYGQNLGMILYRTQLIGPRSGKLVITEPHDYAIVFINGKRIGTIDRARGETALVLPPPDSPESRLDILVEAMGRINFGGRMLDRKGITDRVELAGVTLMNWSVYPLPLDHGFLRSLAYDLPDSSTGPAFYRGSFMIDKPGDTFLDMSAWQKGVVWVNGHNLGRYWSIGPQQRLYLPAPWLKRGKNEVLVLELQGGGPRQTEGKAEPR